MRNVIINLNIKTKKNCVFRLYLPIHEIYDIFMDVYNNTIFESKQYVIDDNNYEDFEGKVLLFGSNEFPDSSESNLINPLVPFRNCCSIT